MPIGKRSGVWGKAPQIFKFNKNISIYKIRGVIMMKKIFVLILISLNTLILNANINSILNQNKTYEIYKADYKEKTFNAVRYINNNYSKEQIKAKKQILMCGWTRHYQKQQ